MHYSGLLYHGQRAVYYHGLTLHSNASASLLVLTEENTVNHMYDLVRDLGYTVIV